MQVAEHKNNPASESPSIPGAEAKPSRAFAEEFAESWRKLPNKTFFFVLLAAWIALFQFLGNATFGYVDTGSLFRWMYVAYKGNDWEEGHGLFIPAVVIALLWWKRSRLLSLDTRVWWPALLLVAASLLLHILGYLVQQPRLSIVSLYFGLYALTGLVWGPEWMRATFFPMFLFVFCIPFASLGAPVTTVTFYMRLFVAKVVAAVGSGILGMDVVRTGTQLSNASHNYDYDVAAACSGLRSSVAILALSTIFGFVSFESKWKRFIMVACAFPLAMLGNTLRMMCIIVAAEGWGKEAGNFVHENIVCACLPYVPAFIGLLLLDSWLHKRSPQKAPAINTP